MSARAVQLFLASLEGRLTDTSPPPLTHAGAAGDRLAREFGGGLPAMRSMLEQQLACEDTRRLAPYTQTLLGLLREVWVTSPDQHDLAIVTGKDRDGWLDQRPLWICEDGVAA